jgi:hypothetical protein
MKKNKLSFGNIIIFLSMLIIITLKPVTVKAEVGMFNPNLYTKAEASCVLIPTSTNKKGIQWEDSFRSDSDSNLQKNQLGANHILINFDMQGMLSVNSSSPSAISYTYNNKTYIFNGDFIQDYRNRISKYRTNTNYWVNGHAPAITMVLLFSGTDTNLKNLICPGAQSGMDSTVHKFYGLNMQDPTAKQTFAALFDYLTKCFGENDTFVQNWIIGNEVDVPSPYNYTGSTDLAVNVNIYAQEYNLFYERMTINSPYSKAYISLSARWNYTDNDSMGGKNFLDNFVKYEGINDWHVAFHAFTPTFTSNARMWEASNSGYLTYKEDSPYVCGANISVVTDYIKKTYCVEGSDQHHIILSEQGFNAYDGSQDSQEKQAAELVYTYYAAANNDMVDATMFLSYKDNNSNSEYSSVKFGLCDDSGNQRISYQAFIDMDSNPNAAELENIRNYINTNCTSFPTWTCKILYTDSPTIYISNPGAVKIEAGTVLPTSTNLYSDSNLYRWSEFNCQTNQQIVIQDWKQDYQLVSWRPGGDSKTSGDYKLICEVITSDQRLYRAETTYQHDAITIKGTCVSQNGAQGRLFGIETDKNPYQQLKYRIRIVNFEKYQEGTTESEYVVLDSGLQTITSGNALWEKLSNMPQAVYFVYFAVYDTDGNLLTDQSSSFVVYENE